jgi:hypothetical protein
VHEACPVEALHAPPHFAALPVIEGPQRRAAGRRRLRVNARREVPARVIETVWESDSNTPPVE